LNVVPGPISNDGCKHLRLRPEECRSAVKKSQLSDVARAAGMMEIRRIAALTSAHGVRLAPHAWGSGVLFAASIHVAMAAANCHILEVTQGYMPMMWELFNEPFDIRPDGSVHAPAGPGLGFTLRADALDRFRYVDGPEFAF
jgi:L-alanine-DL-glutamate epimerase-like enolase superfamily enzyme